MSSSGHIYLIVMAGYSAGDMAGGLYANSIALSVVDIPGNLIYAALADRPFWGRRRTQVRSLLNMLVCRLQNDHRCQSQVLLFGVAGVCLLIGPIAKALTGRSISAGMLKGFAIAGKLCAAGFFNGVYVFAAEVFPTNVRSTGLGLWYAHTAATELLR